MFSYVYAPTPLIRLSLEPQATSSVLYCLCLAMLDNDLRKLPRLLQSLRRAAARIFEALPDDDFTNVVGTMLFVSAQYRLTLRSLSRRVAICLFQSANQV